MSYLTCPLCDKYLFNRNKTRRITTEDKEEEGEFECETKVEWLKELLVPHYVRIAVVDHILHPDAPESETEYTRQFIDYRYTIFAPPYCIMWWEKEQYVKVELWAAGPTGFSHPVGDYLVNKPNTSKEEFLKLYRRFGKLKVFS